VEEIIIKPSIGPGEERIPAVGIFCPNPGDAAWLAEKAKEVGGRRRFLFNSSLHVVPAENGQGEIFVAGPAVGAPMAVMTLEKLIALGCRRILVWGWCGALVETLRVGDLLLPTSGISDEGTSKHYPTSGLPDRNTDWLRYLRHHLRSVGWQWMEGAVWSTDAPYRETRARLEDYVAGGAFGVEMEYTALAAAAAFRGIEMAALLIVSDELWGKVWKPGFRRGEFKRTCRMVGEELFVWLRKINREAS